MAFLIIELPFGIFAAAISSLNGRNAGGWLIAGMLLRLFVEGVAIFRSEDFPRGQFYPK